MVSPMRGKKESAPALDSGRASVREHDGSIPQGEWERGCRLLPTAFLLVLALYVAWEVVECAF